MTRAIRLLLLAGLFLAGCGAGTAAIASGGGDSGGSSNAPPVLSNFTIENPQTTPARVRFVLSDREGDPARLALSYSIGGKSSQLITQIQDLPGNPAQCATSEDGVEYDVPWYFTSESGLPKDGSYTDDVRVTAVLENGIQELVLGANGDFGLGNDPPEIETAAVPTAEVGGTVGIAFVVSDTSDDVVRVRIEYDIVGDDPDLSWRPARPALDTSTPDYAFEGVVANRTGTALEFFWDTHFDLAELEHDVQLRLTAFDSVLNGESLETAPFHVDNNAEPIATLHGDLLVTSPDVRRGIVIPFTVDDEEEDDVEVVIQWRRPEESFPELPATPSAIHEALANPEQSRALHICSEFPRVVTGLTKRVDSTTVELPELASSASRLLAGDLIGREIEFLRVGTRPELVSDGWEANPLRSPVAVLPIGDGTRALVVDAPASGNWRVIEIELASGRLVRELASGPGLPTAAAWERTRESILVASTVSFSWHVDRVDLATGARTALIAQSGFAHAGRVRGIASLGTNAALITVGDELVQLDWSDPNFPRAAAVFDELATPWGVVLDPRCDGRAYLAEHDADVGGGVGRIVAVDLRTHAVEEVLARASDGISPALIAPRDIALARGGTRLLVMCDVDPTFGQYELRGMELGADSLQYVYTITDEVDANSRSVATGEDDLVLFVRTSADELLVGGGVEQKRVITGLDISKRRVAIDPPLDPVLAHGMTWRVLDDVARTRPATGQLRRFVWDSSDVPSGGAVLFRVTPLDSEVGTDSASIAEKTIRAPIDRDEISEVGVADFNFGVNVLSVDVDRDGDLDLVLAGTQLAVYWQTRPREFDPEPTQVGEGTTFGGGPRFVRATDVDGDGQIDLACGYSDGTGTRFAVYWREGAREFDPKPTILLSDPAQHVSIELQAADIDGDGKVDFALGISSSPTLRISWQSAPREFELTSVGNVPTPSGPVSMRIADVEADGDLDIVTNTSALFWQVGPRDFRQSIVAVSGYMQVADVDNDGDLDLAASSGHVLWQSGPGQFDSSPVQVGIGITQFSDVDSDDDLDIVSATQGQGSAQIQWQSQPGVFDPDPLVVGEAPVLGNAAVLQGASDVDGDGRADLVMTGGIDSRIKILWQSNARNIEAEADLLGDSNSLESPYLLRSADLDGDGDLDLASACLADDSLRIWWQERPGRFALQPTVMPLAEIASLCPADIDGDGRIDLAVTIGSSGMLIYWQGALGQFDVAPTNLSNSQFLSYPISLTAEDVDGDGDLDLAFANNNNGGSGKLGVYWQTGTRTFSATPTLVPPNFNQAIADVQDLTVVDIDLDGDRDLVSANQFSLAIFRQTNPGVFQSNPILIQGNFPGTNRPVAVEAADIDGDGDVDLASANHGENGTGTLTLFRRTGTTTFEPVPLLLGNLLPVEFGFEPNDLRIVDVDRDGDPDLACTSSKTDYPVRVYWQLSPWRFDPISSHLGDPITVDQSYALEVADIDGDGDLDLASANIHSETISIFWGGR